MKLFLKLYLGKKNKAADVRLILADGLHLFAYKILLKGPEMTVPAQRMTSKSRSFLSFTSRGFLASVPLRFLLICLKHSLLF